MPIREADPWRMQYSVGVPCPDDVEIPTEERDAWRWYPGGQEPLARHRHAERLGEQPHDLLVEADQHRPRRRAGIGQAELVERRDDVDFLFRAILETGVAEVDDEIRPDPLEFVEHRRVLLEHVRFQPVDRREGLLHRRVHGEIFGPVALIQLGRVWERGIAGQDGNACR